MADGMHGFDEILVNDVEKLLSSLRGYPEISLTNQEYMMEQVHL